MLVMKSGPNTSRSIARSDVHMLNAEYGLLFGPTSMTGDSRKAMSTHSMAGSNASVDNSTLDTVPRITRFLGITAHIPADCGFVLRAVRRALQSIRRRGER